MLFNMHFENTLKQHDSKKIIYKPQKNKAIPDFVYFASIPNIKRTSSSVNEPLFSVPLRT